MEIKELQKIMQENGVVGAGGAGFPTYMKLTDKADTILMNCAECEPLTETSQTVVGEARIRDHENIRYGCGDGRSFPGHYRNQKVLCTDDQCFKSAY